jgi:hypothetical protein
MRHQQDINELIKIVGIEYLNKIKFELCPTIWYSNTYIKNNLPKIENKYNAIEIKDDRAVIMKGERVEEIVLIIHSYVVR